MWASAWHLASWCWDWAFHLLRGGRQVENLLTLSSVLKSLSKVGFLSWLVHPCGCQLHQDVEKNSLLFCVQCTPEIPIYVFYVMRRLYGLQNRHLCCSVLRLFSYTLFLYKLFFILTELQESFPFGSTPHKYQDTVIFYLSFELASLQPYAHSSAYLISGGVQGPPGSQGSRMVQLQALVEA